MSYDFYFFIFNHCDMAYIESVAFFNLQYLFVLCWNQWNGWSTIAFDLPVLKYHRLIFYIGIVL